MGVLSRKCVVFLALALAIGVGAREPAHGGSDQRLIAFYDPDANHQAILSIMNGFNAFLKNEGVPLRFQPVMSTEKLEELLRSSSVDFAIVSSSYLKEHPSRLKPLLVPEANGQHSYRKVLIDRGVGEPNLAGKNIAATTGEGKDRGSTVLAMLKRAGIPADGALVIPVAKDVDALLALSFGQVQAALVTPTSVEVLKRINPVAAKSLRKIYETDPILRAPLCAVGTATNTQLLAALQRMEQDPDGRRAIRSLGFDRWVVYQSNMGGEQK